MNCSICGFRRRTIVYYNHPYPEWADYHDDPIDLFKEKFRGYFAKQREQDRKDVMMSAAFADRLSGSPK